jgi:hypothetical protein
MMSQIDDLHARVATLNEAERVEYNRRLQAAKATKEFSAQLRNDLERFDRSLAKLTAASTILCVIFFVSVVIISLATEGGPLWLGFAVSFGVMVVLIDNQKNRHLTQRTILQQQRNAAEYDWAAIGLETSLLQAILEMEAAIHAKESNFQNLQNISSAQAERKRTLSHYDFQIRNEILLNIQNEKNWWSKIDVLTNRWFNAK